MSCPSSTRERGVASMPPTSSLRCRRTPPAHLGGAIWGSAVIPFWKVPNESRARQAPRWACDKAGRPGNQQGLEGEDGVVVVGGLSSVALIMQSLAKHPAAEHAGGTSPPGPRGARRRPLSAVP